MRLRSYAFSTSYNWMPDCLVTDIGNNGQSNRSNLVLKALTDPSEQQTDKKVMRVWRVYPIFSLTRGIIGPHLSHTWLVKPRISVFWLVKPRNSVFWLGEKNRARCIARHTHFFSLNYTHGTQSQLHTLNTSINKFVHILSVLLYSQLSFVRLVLQYMFVGVNREISSNAN